MMKKITTKLLIMIIIGVLAGAYLPVHNAEAADVKLSSTKKTIYTGEVFTLTLKNAKSTVKWKSSNEKVATVDSNGKVTALGSGTAKITAKYKSATYTCKVTVKTPHISCKSAELYVDGTIQLTMFGAEILRCYSSDENVATVSNEGLIKAIGSGKTDITVVCSDGKNYICRIQVIDANDSFVPITKMDYFAKDEYLKLCTNEEDYLTDNLGETHENVCSFASGSFNDYVTRKVSYKISEEYSYISGTLYRTYNYRTSDLFCKITIYGDNTELWSGYLSNGTEPIEFKASVKNINTLRIEVQYNSYKALSTCAIGEFCLIQ